jgi:hypothetical protein
MELIIDKVRCFGSKQDVPIRPLTLLVGENSTGKTTFLASYRIAWDISSSSKPIDFNEDPFQLGTYDQIANYRFGPGGRAGEFEIGYRIDRKNGSNVEQISLSAIFKKGEAQPFISLLKLGTKKYKLIFSIKPKEKPTVKIKVPSGEYVIIKNLRIPPFLTGGLFSIIPYFIWDIVDYKIGNGKKSNKKIEAPTQHEVNIIKRNINEFFKNQYPRPNAIAPIRSKPERVYSQMEEIQQPSGEHVPMVLAKSFAKKNDPSSIELRKKLQEFAVQCGLFDKITVGRFGKKGVDSPFQIKVGSQSPQFNLVDVGYGVSQVLPILVDSLNAEKKSTFLLQQPEVHLHPRAQAELGTFFGLLVKEHKKQFIIETHSDYLIDRLCMDIRDNKTIKPKDVVILYFEKDGPDVNIHPIEIDKNGNIQGAPPGYRSFFMKEEARFFGAE